MSACKIILIAGVTASGKSALALALAERLGGVIINADSMQVYRELAILSAQPDAADRARAPHRLYGMIPVAEAYSAGRWLTDAGGELESARKAGQVAIVTGGTGLYFTALEHGLADVPDIPEDIRLHWRAALEREGAAALHGELLRRDPAMAARVEPGDSQRIVRALEVIEATGRSLGEVQQESARHLLPQEGVVRLVVMPPRTPLRQRIANRVDAMIAAGALDEVAALAAMKLDPALPAMKALGVPALIAHLEGRAGLADAIAALKTETGRYAKRQTTWARGRMGHWHWIEGEDALAGDRLLARALAQVEAAEA